MALRIDPTIVENIEEITIMGGADNMGNRTGAGEFNFFADPEAAKIVVNCGAKITIIPLNATHSAKFDYNDAARFEALGTKAGNSPGNSFATEQILKEFRDRVTGIPQFTMR